MARHRRQLQTPQPMPLAAVRLSVAIMLAPWEADRRTITVVNLRQLHREMHREPPLVVPGIGIIEDKQRQGCWPTARRALQYGIRCSALGATHHVMLQDDVVLCPDFLSQVRAAVSRCSNVPIALFARRKVISEARQQGSSWAVIPDGIWGQGYCLPSQFISPFLRWEAEHIAPDFKHDDSRLAMFLLEHQRPVWATVPSLVEHALPSNSLLGQSNKGKVATWFCGHRKLDRDHWTKGWQTPPIGANCLARSYYRFYRKGSSDECDT